MHLKTYQVPKHLIVCTTHSHDFTTLESYHDGNYFNNRKVNRKNTHVTQLSTKNLL